MIGRAPEQWTNGSLPTTGIGFIPAAGLLSSTGGGLAAPSSGGHISLRKWDENIIFVFFKQLSSQSFCFF